MTKTERKIRHVLLLAGSAEARALAAVLAHRSEWRVTASLPRPERVAGPMPVETRFGEFDPAEVFCAYLADQQVDVVLDASHPFAQQMSTRFQLLSAKSGVPYARVLRVPWRQYPNETWSDVADEAEAAELITSGQRVFVTTGRATLTGYKAAATAQLFVRRLTEGGPEPEMANVTYVPDTGPFSEQDEIETFQRLNIDVLVARNTGGAASRTKLDAARSLGLKVLMIRRPPRPDTVICETPQAALTWLEGL